MTEIILSPDLQLQRQRDADKAKRLDALKHFKIGDLVQPGEDGQPGILESISEDGFVSIRWFEGAVISGVEGDRLVPACVIGVEYVVEGDPDDPEVTTFVYDRNKCIGYLTSCLDLHSESDATSSDSLYFTATIPIHEQIKVLRALRDYLKRQTIPVTDAF